MEEVLEERGETIISLPNISAEKMAAILHVANAIENISKALISVNTHVTVKDNHFTTGDGGTGLVIDTDE